MSNHPIRLLFVPRETFPTHRVDVEVLFGRELLGRGHEIDFVMQAQNEALAPGAHAWHGRTVWVGRTDCRPGLMHRLRRHWLALVHDLRALSLARAASYDALQVKDKMLIAAIGVIVARRRNLRFFYWLSFPLVENDLQRARTRTARYPFLTVCRGIFSGMVLYKWILPRADHVFVQSERMKQDICARGTDPAKVTAVPMGVDTSDLPTRRATSGAAVTPRIVLGYIGTLEADRRLEVLIDMLADLSASGGRWQLLLIGDAENPLDRIELEARARRLDVSHSLEITGFMPRRAALERLQECDVGLSPIFPSPVLLCGSPTKLMEYLALSLPVVANDHPEQRLVLRESRAGVRVPWSARHFARGVRWIAARTPRERAEMGARGRAWVEANRSYVRLADELEQGYQTLLALPPSRDGRIPAGSREVPRAVKSDAARSSG